MSGPDKQSSPSVLQLWLRRILLVIFAVGDVLGFASWQGNIDIWKEAMTPMVSALLMIACSAGLGVLGLHYWQRIRASGALARTWEAVAEAVEYAEAYLSSPAATDRAVVANVFTRCPEGQKPPQAKFSVGRRRVTAGAPWKSRVPRGTYPLWLARGLIY